MRACFDYDLIGIPHLLSLDATSWDNYYPLFLHMLNLKSQFCIPPFPRSNINPGKVVATVMYRKSIVTEFEFASRFYVFPHGKIFPNLRPNRTTFARLQKRQDDTPFFPTENSFPISAKIVPLLHGYKKDRTIHRSSHGKIFPNLRQNCTIFARLEKRQDDTPFFRRIFFPQSLPKSYHFCTVRKKTGRYTVFPTEKSFPISANIVPFLHG